ncbi:MAG TPA: signal peptidase I [Candidatus Deferrimicrobium sp.]|nr:signal peptidase I [Candidatus Deferrimicrobium sp.]
MDQDFLIQDIQRAEAQRQASKVRRRRERRPLWREYLETAIVALLAAGFLRFFVISAYRVSSASMEDTLLEGDYIFVNKLAYKYGGFPQVGDIVVFKYPNNPQKDFIKRIVAGPGQTVLVADKVLYVNNEVAAIPPGSKHVDKRVLPADLSYRDNFGPYRVPDGSYFVMGDSRDDSRDSRFWGAVPSENVKGKAVFVYWSWQPDPDAPKWEFPYIVNLIQWVGYGLYNFPSHIRWDRIGTPV